VFGIDPDRHSVRTAWERYKITVDNGHIENINTAAESFDLVIMDNSLEHDFNPLGTLLKAYLLLRKGGGLFIATPNCNGLSTRFLEANAHWGHWFLFSPNTMYDILKRIGFAVHRVFAAQETIDQKIIDQGYDTEAYQESLRISLIGEDTVAAKINNLSFCSDYFHVMATRPLHADSGFSSEAELRSIAECSLQQLEEPIIRLSR
jgi:SAM-dependent methyltransferase